MKAGARVFQTVDVEAVDALNPASAIKTFTLEGKPKVVECDLFIAGGGMGAMAAAIRAAQKGLAVCVSEETQWTGGQMTSQGVSAFDENKYVEESGATLMYQTLREKIRQHYGQKNPGDCWVSWCAFEPMVGTIKLHEVMVQNWNGNPIRIYNRTKVLDAKVVRGRVVSVLAVNLERGKFVEFRPRFCIDATELGDLLPLLEIPYSSGAESREQTGEPHAPEQANPDNVQDFTYPFVLEYLPGETHTIGKPPKYSEFAASGKFSFSGYRMFEKVDKLPGSFWTYRRLVAKDLFPQQGYKSDVSMINWESNDLRGENLIDVDNPTLAERLANGKLVSLGFLYWLQTAAPRDDGGKGYPELRLMKDVLGSEDGLSKYPYIRESRRIKAKKTIVEQEIAAATNSGARAQLFFDTVGIGLYPIDIHGHQDVPGAGQASKPFQIPLSAMVQTHIRNFLPACKNIGTTHVTNGAYRLHPVEWAIGEAAGVVAAFCLAHRARPETVWRNSRNLLTVQAQLATLGCPLFWFDDVPTSDPDFAAIQMAAVTGAVEISDDSLHFNPDQARRQKAREAYQRIQKQILV